jgi:FKBP-type peptidyl-prolyl cis-trans isomerase SlyD
MEAHIVEVGEENVIVDFNHPLAGKTMDFSVEVIALRWATAEELDHRHVH